MSLEVVANVPPRIVWIASLTTRFVASASPSTAVLLLARVQSAAHAAEPSAQRAILRPLRRPAQGVNIATTRTLMESARNVPKAALTAKEDLVPSVSVGII